MVNVATKDRILEDAGYTYDFDRRVYVDRTARKIVSVEFVHDHGEADLEEVIAKPSSTSGEWQFYFNSAPSEGVKRILAGLFA